MQGRLGPGTQGQHLQAGVEAPQLLLQAGGEREAAEGQRAPGWHRDTEGRPVARLCLDASAYLGDSELFGMKAKSRRGKKSLGPIMPKPLVRLGCILQNRALSYWGVARAALAPEPGPWQPLGHGGHSHQEPVQVGNGVR